MGKLKTRQKLHISSKNEENREKDNLALKDTDTALPPQLPLTLPNEDLFAGLNIDFGTITKTLSDDTQSVKSYKSIKSNISGQKVLPKKDKLKLRRQLLLQKIDCVNQLKARKVLRDKRKTNAIIGDTNPLHDALPSLELLRKSSSIRYTTSTQPTLKKGILKANKRKKKFVQDVNVYKQMLRNSNFKSNPLEAISRHILSTVEQEHRLLNYNKK